MFCPKCGADVGDGGRFCPECGDEVAETGAREDAPAADRARGGWLRRPLVLGAVALAVGVGVGVAVVSSILAGDPPEDRAIALVPADAAFYATVHLDPSLGQKRAAKGVIDRADGDAEPFEDAIGALVESASPLSYERDIKPHLGNQVALFARPSSDPTLLSATTNPEASRAAMRRLAEASYPGSYYSLREATYRGQPYEHVVYADGGGTPPGSNAFAIIDGFVVLGETSDVQMAIDARRGSSLADSSELAAARERLSEDVIGFAYLDAEPLAHAAGVDEYASRAEVAPLEAIADAGPIAATVSAGDGRLVLDIATRADAGEGSLLSGPSTLLETLPADLTAALALGDIKGPLTSGSEATSEGAELLRDTASELADLEFESDFAPWLGQLGLYLSGDDPDTVEYAFVAETTTPAESDRVIDRIDDFYSSSYDDDYWYGSPVQSSEDGLGFDYTEGDDLLSVRGDDDRVVAGFGGAGFSAERALDAEGGFGESELYRRSADLLDGHEPFLSIDAARARLLLERALDAEYSETYEHDIRPWLSGLDTVAGGVRTTGDGLHIRLVAGLGG